MMQLKMLRSTNLRFLIFELIFDHSTYNFAKLAETSVNINLDTTGEVILELEHSSESKRLEALFEYKILDTLPEKEFNDIVMLASSIAQSEIALISLIDSERQWFKAKLGLDAHETCRNVSFCTHAIMEEKVLEVCDAHLDSRFQNNPLVTGAPHIRFYAGAPLINPEGHKLGTVCVIDSQPKELTSSQRTQLQGLARMVVSRLELRKADHQLKNYQDLLTENAKMSALGEMAACLAHEINNPLTVISGRIALALNKIEKDAIEKERIREDLHKVEESVKRITQISKGLRAYARNEERDPPQIFSLAESVRTTLNFCQEKLLNAKVDVKVELDEEIQVNAHPGEVSQVILNLIQNSYDAIKNHDSPWISIKLENKNNKCSRLKIRDSGHGIAEKLHEKLGTPFFTTKPAGEGTGLGLGISKRIMEGSGGQLYYNPSAEHTEFIIEFPRVKLRA